ncbi:MAG TPA: SDR family NAD(P)-dependent oxidoreductase [Negativicutes bacterium]|nr:SDR family NAD(P)-dependent oxidoreductase [Negativicutes bacterium]
MRAIITGGSSGLGYEIAKQLRVADHDVIIIETKKDKLEKARDQLEAIPAGAKAASEVLKVLLMKA